MSLGKANLEAIIFSFRKQKELAEKAFRQVADEDFFKQPGEAGQRGGVANERTASSSVA